VANVPKRTYSRPLGRHRKSPLALAQEVWKVLPSDLKSFRVREARKRFGVSDRLFSVKSTSLSVRDRLRTFYVRFLIILRKLGVDTSTLLPYRGPKTVRRVISILRRTCQHQCAGLWPSQWRRRMGNPTQSLNAALPRISFLEEEKSSSVIRPYIGPLMTNGSYYYNPNMDADRPYPGLCVICREHLPSWRWYTTDMCVDCDFRNFPEDGPMNDPIRGPKYLGREFPP